MIYPITWLPKFLAKAALDGRRCDLEIALITSLFSIEFTYIL